MTDPQRDREARALLANAPLQQGKPPTDRVFYARHHVPMKWTPYKPTSEQARRGTKGRWQEAGEYGGWNNSSVLPAAGAWIEDAINRSATPSSDTQGREPSASGVSEAELREDFRAAMVDAARARGGAGAQFIADGHTNLWLDIAYDAFAFLAALSEPSASTPDEGEGLRLGTRCDLCGMRAPASLAHDCNRPECAYRPAQPATGTDEGEGVDHLRALIDLIEGPFGWGPCRNDRGERLKDNATYVRAYLASKETGR